MTHHVPVHSVPSGVVSSGWLAADSTFGQVTQRKTGRALAASLALHGLGLLIILAAMAMVPETVNTPERIPEKYDLVFVRTVAPGGGRGGGGNSMPAPPPTVELKAALPTPTVIESVETPPPPPTLIAPIQTAAVVMPAAGAVTGLGAAPSLGGGTGGGSGSGKGTGTGSGDGAGIGPGSGGGIGGGPMGPGSGATPPTLLRGVDPAYTSAAMQAKIQGTVELEVLVSPTGAVSDVKVIRSLDKIHGLDDLAIVTAKKWLFRPARFQGQPVAYVVIIQMAFNLR